MKNGRINGLEVLTHPVAALLELGLWRERIGKMGYSQSWLFEISISKGEHHGDGLPKLGVG